MADRGPVDRKTRGYGEGSIQERVNSKGEITSYRVQVYLPGGKRKSISARTYREAARICQELGVESRAGRLTSSRRQSLETYLKGWLEGVKPTIKPKAYDSYDLNVRRISRHIGGFRLDSLRPPDIQKAYAALSADGLSAAGVAQAHRTLHVALERAVDWGLIGRNPCDAVKPPRAHTREIEPLTAEQAHILFDSTQDDRDHALWVFLCTTGLRAGEALGLRWKDVDLDDRTVRVTQTVQRQNGKGIVFSTPKSASSRRLVSMIDLAVDALRRHRTQQKEWRLQMGKNWHDNGLVFPSDQGLPQDSTRVLYRFHKALERAGLPKRRQHDLRHTAATLMLEEGVHPKVVQDMLGHSTYTLTMNTYSHVAPSMQRDATDKLDKIFPRRLA